MKSHKFCFPATTSQAIQKLIKPWLPLLLITGTLTLPATLHAQYFVIGNQPSGQSYPDYVISLDANHDGKLDLIVANTSAGSALSVLTNDGAGNFQLSHQLNTGQSLAYYVTTADVNGDGHPDLITADYADSEAGSFTVLTNDGNGNFIVSGTYPAGQLSIGLAAADINGDNKPDLISADPVGNGLILYTNNGSGGFVLSKNLNFTSDWAPVSVVAADVNNDNKPDIITANYDDNSVTVLTNDGTGNFAVANTYPVGLTPNCVIAADVNGDGKMDFVTADLNGSTLTVLTNNGSGGLALSQTLHSPSSGALLYVVAADLNGDQHVDLVAANYDDTIATNNDLIVFTNNGAGIFGLNTTLFNPGLQFQANGPAVGNGFPNGVAAGDMNGDGRMDLVSAVNGATKLTVYLNLPTPPQLTATLTQDHQLFITWPNGMTGVTLQTNSDLTMTNWGNYTGTITSTNTVSLAPTARQLFFRLK